MNKSFVVMDHKDQSWNAKTILCPVCDSDQSREFFKLVKSRCNPQRPADTFVKCKICSLVYINPRILFPVRPINDVPEIQHLVKAQTRPFYRWLTGDKTSAPNKNQNGLTIQQPDQNLRNFERLSSNELIEDLERIRKYKPAGKLLEIGCSTGAFLSLATEVGYKTLGIEPDEEAMLHARDRFGLEVIHGIVGDPRPSIELPCPSIELPSNKFDVVVMLAVLEHVLDVRMVVQSVKRCLRPGGIFYLMTPDVTSLYARILGSRWNMYHVCWHHQFFSKHTLRRLLTDQGFEVLETWGVYRGRPIRLRRMIKQVLTTFGISLDVVAVMAKKVR